MKSIMRWRGKGTRDLRSASVSIFLLSLFLVILMVVGADRAEKKYGLKQDFSYNQITTHGAVTTRILRELEEPVHIHALFTPGEEDEALVGLLERYEAVSDFLSFSVENLSSNPLLALRESDNPDDHPVSPDCLIVRNEKSGRTRILDGSNFLSYSYDMRAGEYYISGLNYEKALTEALVYVSMESSPAVQVLTGHDELDASTTAFLESRLLDGNCTFERMSLIRGDLLDPDRLLMILSPKKDLLDSELSAIEAFVKKGGNLFITTDFDDPYTLDNLDALLRTFGIIKKEGIVVAQAEDVGTYLESPAYLLPYMEVTEPTEALITSGTDILLLAGARAFALPEKDTGGDLIVQTVLMSGNAYLRRFDPNTSETLEWQEGDETGVFPLSLLSQRAYGDATRSKAFIIGNSSVFTDAWLSGNTYSGEFLKSILSYLGHRDMISLEILSKDAVRPPMLSGTSPLPLAVIVTLPLAVFASALVVLLPRKRT